jgi:hypothetical protein
MGGARNRPAREQASRVTGLPGIRRRRQPHLVLRSGTYTAVTGQGSSGEEPVQTRAVSEWKTRGDS